MTAYYFAAQGEEPAPLEAADIVRTLTDPKDTIAAALIVEAVNSNDGTEALLKELLAAAASLLHRIDNITTEDFSKGGERTQREHLRAVIAKVAGR